MVLRLSAFLILSLSVIPAVASGDTILYSFSADYSGLSSDPPSSTLSWSFEVPSILATETVVTTLLSSSFGAGWGACGAMTSVTIPDLNPTGTFTGFSAVEVAQWTTFCGPGNEFIGAAAGFEQPPTELGVFDVYSNSGVVIGTLSIADVPEPALAELLGIGLTGVAGWRFKRTLFSRKTNKRGEG